MDFNYFGWIIKNYIQKTHCTDFNSKFSSRSNSIREALPVQYFRIYSEWITGKYLRKWLIFWKTRVIFRLRTNCLNYFLLKSFTVSTKYLHDYTDVSWLKSILTKVLKYFLRFEAFLATQSHRCRINPLKFFYILGFWTTRSVIFPFSAFWEMIWAINSSIHKRATL